MGSSVNKEKTAFPLVDGAGFTVDVGMDLRDFFAGLAAAQHVNGNIPKEHIPPGMSMAEHVARNSYTLADALMEYRASLDPKEVSTVKSLWLEKSLDGKRCLQLTVDEIEGLWSILNDYICGAENTVGVQMGRRIMRYLEEIK